MLSEAPRDELIPADLPSFVSPAIYAELKVLARLRIRDSGSARLIDTTALVHESWLKLSAVEHLSMDHRGQFFAYVGKVMRSVIVDIAKARGRQKRGGGAGDVTLELSTGPDAALATSEPVRLDEALRELEARVPRLGQVVEMRYFAGLSENEIAEALGVNERTVRRDWDKARLLLREILSE
ncbi:MAG: sigma-70 family RNA polymerase sigma factor [Rudaea sp.]|uniref:ECF-type sigma factor n=1 Tax=unclassified Rudaea TaxID=2627037 RepID=UPI0010F87BB0|nr:MULTISPECIES: ECF-type sigma factor [unclassified Rudaea]MBN8884804.1 sigma-70 family RNA polymerase sigma factor [Rudaea sp.]MBR0345492.1 sigma-70 family RNA polymerase sigma factor [Rudaea sp.]